MANEKCIRQLPTIRISDTLEMLLMRMAAQDDRKLSEYVRLVLERHVFGHAASLKQEDGTVADFGALQSSADEFGGVR